MTYQSFSKRCDSVLFFHCFVHGNRLPTDKSASKSLYSNVVKGDFEESPTWMRKYQQEDEEDALKKAIEESVKVTISVEK